MTKLEFIHELAQAVKGKRRTIYGPSGGGIRIVGDDGKWFCPLTAVAAAKLGGEWTLDKVYYAGRMLGLSFEDTKMIMAASDYGVYRELQMGILVACGFRYRKKTGPMEPVTVGDTIKKKKETQ